MRNHCDWDIFEHSFRFWSLKLCSNKSPHSYFTLVFRTLGEFCKLIVNFPLALQVIFILFDSSTYWYKNKSKLLITLLRVFLTLNAIDFEVHCLNIDCVVLGWSRYEPAIFPFAFSNEVGTRCSFLVDVDGRLLRRSSSLIMIFNDFDLLFLAHQWQIKLYYKPFKWFSW